MTNFSNKKALLFDFGDTLASTVPTYTERIMSALRESGYQFSNQEFNDSYLRTDYIIYKNYEKNGDITPNQHRSWLFENLRKFLKLEDDAKTIRDNVKNNMKRINFKRVLLNNVSDILNQLSKMNFTLAILSNNDGKVDQKCKQLGIYDYFELIVDSSNVGIVKPNLKIFNYTLKELGLEASECIHIGDLYGADILAAINAGIDPIWLNKAGATNYENIKIPQIDELSQILDMLN